MKRAATTLAALIPLAATAAHASVADTPPDPGACCSRAPECPEQFSFDAATHVCAAIVPAGCPSPGQVHPMTGRCETQPRCEPGFRFDRTINRCARVRS